MSDKANLDGLIAQLIHAGADVSHLDTLIAQLIHAGPEVAHLDGLIAQLVHAGPEVAHLDGLIAQLVHAGPEVSHLDGLIAQLVHNGVDVVQVPKFRDRLNRTTTDGPGIAETRLASGQPSTFREALKNLGRVSSGQTNDLPFSLSDRTGNYDS
jgi:hypothetical protein